MRSYYITHTDQHGERHQLTGAWQAESKATAIAAMCRDAGCEDDGQYEAHEVQSENDVIN